MLAAVLVFLAAASPLLVAAPPEPGARVISERPAFQGVVADLDGDGAREVVLLTHAGGPSIVADAWGELPDGSWERVGSAVEVASSASTGGYGSEAPVRLLVRRVDGRDAVTLVRQPSLEVTAEGRRCCLQLFDVRLAVAGLALEPVVRPMRSADAVHVIDLDGDGTDELVATRSLPPLGDVSYPVAARVLRWTGDGFTVTSTRLPVGSGDTPILLGDSDGRPGDELGIIATEGRPELHRVSLRDGDRLGVEDAGLVVRDAVAVPLDDGRGIAVLTGAAGLTVHAWPRDGSLEGATAQVPMGSGRILGTVVVDEEPRIVVHQAEGGDRLHVLGLPNLTPPRFGAVTRSPAAAAFGSGPVTPYVGMVPGGIPVGQPAILYAGNLLSSLGGDDTTVPLAAGRFAALAGAHPIGLAGRDGTTLAILHAPSAPPQPDPRGGRLDPPAIVSPAAVTIAPLETSRNPGSSDGALEPGLDGATRIGSRRVLAVGPTGFTARVVAPPGSRVYVAGADPSVVVLARAVPDAGALEIPLPPPIVETPDPQYRATLVVTTPAGRSFLASWEARVLTQPPPVTASAATPFGSGEVLVAGSTVPYASVTVEGLPVAVGADGGFQASVEAPPWPTRIDVVVTDPVGNQSSATLSVVGIFDYRSLPWIPIAVLLVGAAATALYLRVPRGSPAPARAPGDDAVLEELEEPD